MTFEYLCSVYFGLLNHSLTLMLSPDCAFVVIGMSLSMIAAVIGKRDVVVSDCLSNLGSCCISCGGLHVTH